MRPPLDLHDSYDEYKKYEEENDVEDRREIEVYGVPAVSNFADRKHFIALSRAGNLVGIGETHEQLKPVVTEYLRKRSSETVTIYQSISSTGIKLDTETVTY